VDIGRSLREARESRGLGLDLVERETRIRARYLQALEFDRFELLPGGAYTRGFLRGYAEFLGLDGQRFLDEYDARFPAAEPILELELSPLARPLVSRGLVTAAVAAGCIVLLGLLAWRLGTGAQGTGPMPSLAQIHRSAPRVVPITHAAHAKNRQQPVLVARLALVAARGDCWLSIRLGSETGSVLWEGMLDRGKSLLFARHTLWVRIGAPWNLDARLNGKPLRTLPTTTGNVVVTAAGATRAT
jgi:hypothetical protein